MEDRVGTLQPVRQGAREQSVRATNVDTAAPAGAIIPRSQRIAGDISPAIAAGRCIIIHVKMPTDYSLIDSLITHQLSAVYPLTIH